MKSICALFPVLIILAALVSLSGCLGHSYSMGHGADSSQPAVYFKWHHHFLFGLIAIDDPVDVDALCPNGGAYVEDGFNFPSGLVALLSLGGLVYAPTTVEVWCNEDASAEGADVMAPQGDEPGGSGPDRWVEGH